MNLESKRQYCFLKVNCQRNFKGWIQVDECSISNGKLDLLGWILIHKTSRGLLGGEVRKEAWNWPLWLKVVMVFVIKLLWQQSQKLTKVDR